MGARWQYVAMRRSDGGGGWRGRRCVWKWTNEKLITFHHYSSVCFLPLFSLILHFFAIPCAYFVWFFGLKKTLKLHRKLKMCINDVDLKPSQAKSTVFVSRWNFLNKYQVARRSFFLSSHIVVYQWAWTKLPLLLLLFFQSHRSNNLHFLLFFVVVLFVLLHSFQQTETQEEMKRKALPLFVVRAVYFVFPFFCFESCEKWNSWFRQFAHIHICVWKGWEEAAMGYVKLAIETHLFKMMTQCNEKKQTK